MARPAASYLHPVTHAFLAGDYAAEGNTRRANINIRKGCEAAIALALDIPGIYVNPFHFGLSDAERDALHAAGH